MKLGLLVPVGRTDKFGYQYDNFTKLILSNHEKFADRVVIVASSRYVKNELFENRPKVEYISNHKTWFKQENGEEIFSMSHSAKNMNYIRSILEEEGYDLALQIHINQFIPESSFDALRKSCEKIVKKKRIFGWLYKSYQIGNVIFNSDRRVPWILNLKEAANWSFGADSIINKNTKKRIKIQTGNFRRYNEYSIRDFFGHFTLQDAEEKYNFTIKELKILTNTYNPNNPDELVFNKSVWSNYMERKFSLKKKSKKKIDIFERELLELRRDDFISHIFEKKFD